MRLGVKAGMVRVWVAGKKPCDPLVVHGTYLNTLEMYHDKARLRIHVTLLTLLQSDKTVIGNITHQKPEEQFFDLSSK